jgi:small subunit ribosomal protein S24e
MEIRILEERTNPLLKRHELRFEVAHATAATPTRESVRGELAKAVNAPKDRVIIERMRPRFGTAVTRGEANVYETTDAAKSITREHILVRNGLKEKAAKAAAEAPAAPPPPSAGPTKPEASPVPAAPAEPAKPAPAAEAKSEAKPADTKETAPPAAPHAAPSKRAKPAAKKE